MMRKRFPTWGWPLAFIFAVLVATITARGESPEASYGGHYELADTKSRSFSLDVKQTNARAEVSFSAAMADGSGSAPDGSGKGRIEDGVLSFKFKDSFNNEGTCTLAPAKHGYQLMMTVTKVADPGPFHFYGSVLLKKISDKAQ